MSAKIEKKESDLAKLKQQLEGYIKHCKDNDGVIDSKEQSLIDQYFDMIKKGEDKIAEMWEKAKDVVTDSVDFWEKNGIKGGLEAFGKEVGDLYDSMKD
jgi:hypothetical protein